MNARNTLSRITIDIPREDHKRLKSLAAILGKSMREIVIESIEERLLSANFPNEETLKAIKNVEQKKGMLKAKDAGDLFKKLGI